jgi:hypothetical protein
MENSDHSVSHRASDGYTDDENKRTIKPGGTRYPSGNLTNSSRLSFLQSMKVACMACCHSISQFYSQPLPWLLADPKASQL